MRWYLSTPGSAEYILPVTLSTSVTPVSPYNRRRSLKMYLIERVWVALGGHARANLQAVIEHSEAVIQRVWRCTWRPWSCELAGRNRASLEIHSEIMIEQIWRCTWRPCSWELAGRNRASLEIHLEAVTSEFGDALAGYDRARLEEYLEAVDLEGGATAAETLFIG